MAKLTELDKNTHCFHLSSTVRFGNDNYSLSAPPFPSATSNNKAKANVFNWWESSIFDQMQLEVPIMELMNVIGDNIPMEPISAKLIAQKVSTDIFTKFFGHGLFKPVCFGCFADSYHDKMIFEEEHISNRPEDLSYCRFKTVVDPSATYKYMLEPEFTAVFDLALKQIGKIMYTHNADHTTYNSQPSPSTPTTSTHPTTSADPDSTPPQPPIRCLKFSLEHPSHQQKNPPTSYTFTFNIP
jgi:hypothetical protein